ncbi:hypothetical protein AA0Y32_16790 [Georgenia phoenicis]|uniref:hypothetical protein n=1 Tax=unclassified Georgenia TaxID=2626815 RepID=UPI0039AEF73A
MRRLLAACAVGLLLLGCAEGATSAPAPPSPAVDLAAESERLTTELGALDTVSTAQAQVRSGATWGRQVVIEAETSSTDPAEQLALLDSLVHAGWDTAAFVPTDVSTVLGTPDGTVLDARDLGMPLQGARPDALYERFGPPAADPGWRP